MTAAEASQQEIQYAKLEEKKWKWELTLRIKPMAFY